MPIREPDQTAPSSSASDSAPVFGGPRPWPAISAPALRGKCHIHHAELIEIIKKNFDLRPGMIVQELDLWKPIYNKTAAYGHFGREEFTWEQPKKLTF